MAKSATVKLRIDEQKRDRIKEIAAHEDRSMSYVIEQAIDERLALEEAQIRGIRQGITELDDGMGVPDAKVKAWVESLGTDNELPRPEAEKIR